ncbi:MAG: S1 RNA-binding domain-containing protein [Patescibacteria group bacterium]
MEELLKQSPFSFSGYKRGDTLEGTISSVSGREVLIDIGGKMEGVVGQKEWEEIKDFVARLKVGDKIKAVVVTAENDQGQMILSIKRAAHGNRWEKFNKLLETGEAISVRGVEINRGGLIAETEGIRGFIPSSQLSVEHQADLAKLINKTLMVKVIEVNREQNRLVFSERANVSEEERKVKLDLVKKSVTVGEKYTGKIAAIMPYGIFVSLESGADGLVHISEVSWEKSDDLEKIFKLGEEIEVLVLGINEADGKLNLSIRQLTEDPWTKLAGKYKEEQQVRGKVAQVTNYGVFVTMDKGVDGLIHITKIPPGTIYEVGQDIRCTIETVDLKNHKISLIPVLTEKPVGYK